MFKFLQVPIPENLDFYETTRIRLTWNMHLLLILTLAPLVLISAYTQSIYSFIYAGSLALILTSLLIVKKTGNFRLTSASVAVILYVVVIYSMFQVDNYIHYLEPFWALLVVLYVYFTHGKIWGGLLMVFTILATVFFFLYRINSSIDILNNTDSLRLITKGIEFSICLSLIGYIIHKFILLKNHAENELRLMNDALRKEKDLVESRDKEKTILLQEIHHRVKNNLQIVMSLLRMQSNKITSSETKSHFNDAINRVLTMSLIHQKLYESDNLSAVDLSEYVESLASDILRSSQVPMEIEKDFSIEVPEIGSKTIVPLALIITELISNSAKHAFDQTEKPKICLCVSNSKDSTELELKYKDNGTWKESNEDSFGTQLIDALTEQLEGSYKLETSEKGSKYTFQFKQID